MATPGDMRPSSVARVVFKKNRELKHGLGCWRCSHALHLPLLFKTAAPPCAPLQLVCKFVVLACIYATALPILYILVAVFLTVAGFVDRWNLLRVFEPPPETKSSRAA